MSKPVALILGATGAIGKATVKYLAASSASKLDIRAGSRSPSSAPASVKLPGVEVVKVAVGDDKQNLKKAFEGVDRLFLIPPAIEFAAGIVNDAVEVARESDVKHVVLLSSPSAAILPDHKYACSKGSFYLMEHKVKESFPDATIINHPFFMENNFGYASSIKSSGSFTNPLNPDSKVPWIAVDDSGKFNAAILSDPEKHMGKYYRLISDLQTLRNLAQYISEAGGQEVKYIHQTYEQFGEALRKAGAPEHKVELYTHLYSLIGEGHETMTRGLSQDHFNVTGEQPLTLQQWCQQHIKQLMGS